MLCYVCYVVLLSILLLMVKLSLKYPIRNQGMLPLPALVKVIVAVLGKKKKETWDHSFNLFTHMFYKKNGIQGTEKKRGEQQMKPVCFLVSYFVFHRNENSQGPLFLKSVD